MVKISSKMPPGYCGLMEQLTVNLENVKTRSVGGKMEMTGCDSRSIKTEADHSKFGQSEVLITFSWLAVSIIKKLQK